jgi:hypothetical protein
MDLESNHERRNVMKGNAMKTANVLIVLSGLALGSPPALADPLIGLGGGVGAGAQGGAIGAIGGVPGPGAIGVGTRGGISTGTGVGMGVGAIPASPLRGSAGGHVTGAVGAVPATPLNGATGDIVIIDSEAAVGVASGKRKRLRTTADGIVIIDSGAAVGAVPAVPSVSAAGGAAVESRGDVSIGATPAVPLQGKSHAAIDGSGAAGAKVTSRPGRTRADAAAGLETGASFDATARGNSKKERDRPQDENGDS